MRLQFCVLLNNNDMHSGIKLHEKTIALIIVCHCRMAARKSFNSILNVDD